jgi:DNA-binding response OmpR family regulator
LVGRSTFGVGPASAAKELLLPSLIYKIRRGGRLEKEGKDLYKWGLEARGIPVVPEKPMPSLETPITSSAGSRAVRHVLVADDELRVRELCGTILSKMGCRVTTASSGDQALVFLEEGVDVLLTDLHMPGKTGGKELAARARSGEKTDVIIMTAFPDTDSAIQAVKNGVSDYLTKPFTAETLRLSVEKCFQRRELFQQLHEARRVRAEMDVAYEEQAWAEKIRGIYGQFTSPEVVQMVLEHPHDFWKRGEERDVTLLVAEVDRFAETFADRPPQGKIEMLNKIFNLLTEAIQADMGHISRIHGESLMAIFGAPVALVNHAASASRAARRIKSLWESFAAPFRSAQGPSIGLKMAIHSDRVIAGCLGIKTGTEYGIIGPGIRTAEELLRSAKPGQVVASFGAVRRAHQEYSFSNHGYCVGAAYQDEIWELGGASA